jgi:hypothetical protein
MTRPSTNARLNQAFTRLLAGQATVSDGQLNVANLCREAGVGRDSYYRSPPTFKATFETARANQAGQRPELATLRQQTAELKSEHQRATRERKTRCGRWRRRCRSTPTRSRRSHWPTPNCTSTTGGYVNSWKTANPRRHAWPTTAELAGRPGTAPADWTS